MARIPVYNTKQLTSRFGGARRHRGIDYGWNVGGKVYNKDVFATEAGTVYVGSESGTGSYVVLDGKTGRWLYAHLQKGSQIVTGGQKVKEGQRLATMGNTGAAFGVHLHLGLKRGGKYVDPLPYLSAPKPAPKPPAKPRLKSLDTIAREVIAGKWGNNPTRATKLRKAGYNPGTIQVQVNRILRRK